MADMKTSLMRLGGRGIARLIRHVEKTSDVVYAPADLKARLRAEHPCIVAGWHGQFMMLACLHPGDIRVEAMVARHGDAELIGAALEQLNTHLIRGAGAGDRKRDRGGAAALRLAVKSLVDGASLVMTADIPPGPARVAGLGIIMIAQLSGRPIVPVGAATKRFASFDTWSRMTLNLPYSKLAFVGGEPIHVPPDADADAMEAKRRELQAALNAAHVKAYALAGADLDRATPLDQLAAQSPPPPGIRLQAYGALMSALRPAAPLLLNVRARQGKEETMRRGERFGFAGHPRPEGRLIWTHAASVGETLAALPLIDDILSDTPGARVLLTTGTTTSADLAARRLPPNALHQYVPLDVPQYATRFLNHWRPDLALFTESDIWPNLVLAASRRRIPLILVNARMSPRSQRRWRNNARVGRPLFSRFCLVLAQNDAIAKSIRRLGAPNVIIAGNLKIDAPPLPVDSGHLDALRSAIGDRPMLLAASTHPGEEAIVAEAHQTLARALPNLLTIIAPRHPSRGGALAKLFEERGLTTVQRSAPALPSAGTSVYVADTIGELGTLYALAPVSFIGGSLIAHGGQNPFEAIRCGSAVVAGPHIHNFQEAYDALVAARGAVIVNGPEEISRTVERLLTAPDELAAMRKRATEALAGMSGARAATMSALQPFLARLKDE